MIAGFSENENENENATTPRMRNRVIGEGKEEEGRKGGRGERQ